LLYQSAPIFRMFMVRSTSNSLIHAVRAASRPFEISQDTPDCPNHSLQFIRLLSRFSVTRHAQNPQRNGLGIRKPLIPMHLRNGNL
jgi:hypothetical protein